MDSMLFSNTDDIVYMNNMYIYMYIWIYCFRDCIEFYFFFFKTSVPDDERMLKKAGEAVEGFKDIVFPSGYEPGAKKRVIITGILQ